MTKSKFAAAAIALFVLLGGVSFAASQAGEDALLSQSWTTMQTASLYQRYKKQNPAESARLEAFWANGGTVPAISTAFGRALLLEAQAYWSLKTPTPPPVDTIPPTVSLTAPVNGTTVSGTITVSADAADNVGVTKVEFFRDGAVFATDTTAPYAVSFDTLSVTNGSHTFGPRAYDAAGNATSGAAAAVTVSNAAPPPASVTLTQVDGGTSYYGRFTNGASMDASSFFPIGVWGAYNQDLTNRNLDAQIGINTYVWVADDSYMDDIRADGRFKVIQAQEQNRAAVGSETAGWLLADEIDMQQANPTGAAQARQQLAAILAGLPQDGRFRYANYGKGVIFWNDTSDAEQYVNDFTQVVSDDIYWFSDGGDNCTQYQGGYLFGLGRAMTSAECRRASNYGKVVERMRTLDAMDGVRQPIWNFVETGHPFSDGQSIQPAQIRAAVWHSLIAGARGIIYFQHSFGGSCVGDHHTLRTNCEGNTPMVTSVDAQIKSLAPVLNSPTVTSGFTASASVKAMAKWDGSNFYVLAGSTNNAASTGSFQLPCVGAATATVVGESRTVPVVSGSWSDSFVDGNTVHIYRIDGGGRCGL